MLLVGSFLLDVELLCLKLFFWALLFAMGSNLLGLFMFTLAFLAYNGKVHSDCVTTWTVSKKLNSKE